MRVIAVSHTDPQRNVAYVFGEGELVDEEVPHDAAGPLASMACSLQQDVPKILLDSGQVVYGCECWWGTPEEMDEQLRGMQRVPADIKELRFQYEQQQAEYLGVED